MPSQPTLVLVTGAPGSGKTTLSRPLSEALRLPCLSRDRFRTGLSFTSGGWSEDPQRVPSRKESIDVFLGTVEMLLERGVSLVADYVLGRDGFPEGSRIPDLAECVIVKTSTPVATERYLNRLRDDPLLNRRAVLRALGHSSIEDALAERSAGASAFGPLLFDVGNTDLRTLTVDTTDGYVPGLEEIVEFVLDH